jgi:protein TonB
MLFGMLFLAPAILSAQTEDNGKRSSINKDEEVFVEVEQYPEFSGGEEARMKFLVSNIVYPKQARDSKIEGKVIVSFIVEKDGSITNVEVLRSAHPLLDAEAIRVTKLMPKWKPGKQKGKPVRCKFSMPIAFKLEC